VWHVSGKFSFFPLQVILLYLANSWHMSGKFSCLHCKWSYYIWQIHGICLAKFNFPLWVILVHNLWQFLLNIENHLIRLTVKVRRIRSHGQENYSRIICYNNCCLSIVDGSILQAKENPRMPSNRTGLIAGN